jgi:hypothetical protein
MFRTVDMFPATDETYKKNAIFIRAHAIWISFRSCKFSNHVFPYRTFKTGQAAMAETKLTIFPVMTI